jgi:Fe-S cluster assembly iron-binding protein IscA
MEINITDKAKEELKNMLQGQEQSDKKIRVVMTGIS